MDLLEAKTIPRSNKIQQAFIAGARNTVDEIQGLGIITGDYDNAAKGREAAATLIGNGADVIWHAADVTGLGAIQGAVAGKAKVMGCYPTRQIWRLTIWRPASR